MKNLRNIKWIELIDSKFNRSYSKKFPILNFYLFTKADPDGEIQGQTMLGKFTTHEYHCTDIEYKDSPQKDSAQKLQDAILGFFEHYRTDEAKEKYSALDTRAFQEEFSQLEKHVKACWPIKTCELFSLSLRTNFVESFFATRLFYVPKNLKFIKTYSAKMKSCAMRWNETHISNYYKNTFGESGSEYRIKWHRNVHQEIFIKHPQHEYSERRGIKIRTPAPRSPVLPRTKRRRINH